MVQCVLISHYDTQSNITLLSGLKSVVYYPCMSRDVNVKTLLVLLLLFSTLINFMLHHVIKIVTFLWCRATSNIYAKVLECD